MSPDDTTRRSAAHWVLPEGFECEFLVYTEPKKEGLFRAG